MLKYMLQSVTNSLKYTSTPAGYETVRLYTPWGPDVDEQAFTRDKTHPFPVQEMNIWRLRGGSGILKNDKR